MPKRKRLDHEKIIELSAEGYSSDVIASMIGAKSRDYVQEIIHKYQTKTPGWFPGIKSQHPGIAPLDTGKVKALHKAGWCLQKIHGEFSGNYSVEEIRKAIANG